MYKYIICVSHLAGGDNSSEHLVPIEKWLILGLYPRFCVRAIPGRPTPPTSCRRGRGVGLLAGIGDICQSNDVRPVLQSLGKEGVCHTQDHLGSAREEKIITRMLHTYMTIPE